MFGYWKEKGERKERKRVEDGRRERVSLFQVEWHRTAQHPPTGCCTQRE